MEKQLVYPRSMYMPLSAAPLKRWPPRIVCPDDGWVVPRLAQELSNRTDWELSANGGPGHNIEYFMPYYARFTAGSYLHPRPIAAWFTHIGVGSANRMLGKSKEELWYLAARMTDLRLTCSDQYLEELSSFGPTEKVTPGVDQDFFSIDPRPRANSPLDDKWIIGVAGLASVRKGVELVQKLALRETVVASGDGWPKPICGKFLDWKQMPSFYRKLSVFLCASTVEGIPMPPLEALACGTPVVIPSGVGMLDELPEAPGCRHFEAGNFDSMMSALELVQNEHKDLDPRYLRGLVSNYTLEAWARSHVKALRKLEASYD